MPKKLKSQIIKGGLEEKVENRPEYLFKNGAKYLGQWLVGADEIRHG